MAVRDVATGNRTRLGWWSADVAAGVTVALVGLPQCLAYALMSGLPPAYGLSTAIVAGLVAAAVGKSAQIVTGPTNTTGLLVLAALTPFLGVNGLIGQQGLPALATLTLLAGVIRLIAAVAGGAHLVRFLPESVLVGFTAGAGILIGMLQLDEALGLSGIRASNLAAEVGGVAGAVGGIHAPAVIVTVVVVATLVFTRRLSTRVPRALFVVVGTAAAAWVFSLDIRSGLPLAGDRAALPEGWPPGAMPSLDLQLVRSLFVPALAIVLLGSLELTVTARAGGARPDLRRELFAQGWANTIAAFASSFPASASLTRSALLRLGGGRTRLAAASGAILTAPILFLGGHLVAHIPQASLSGVLLYTAFRMIDRHAMGRLWRASAETRLLLMVTLVATLVLPLEWAILLGSGTGLVIHLARTSAPRLTMLRPEDDRLVPVGAGEQPATVVLEVSGDLHYAAVPPFVDEVERLLPAAVSAVVIDLSHAHQLRFTALRAFERIEDELRRNGAELVLAGVDDDARSLIERSGSPVRIVRAEEEPGLSVRRALASLGGI